MFKSIRVLNFADECSTMDAQSRPQHQKLFISFNKCFPILKQKGVLVQNLLLLSAEIFRMHIFQVPVHILRQESSFLALLMVKKGQGLLYISKKSKGLFFTFKNGWGTFITSKKGQGTFLTSIKEQGTAPSEKRKT